MLGKYVIATIALCTATLSAAGEPVLKLATFEYPPYIEEVGSEAQGMAVDIIKEAFKRIDRPISITFYPVARAVHLLETGEVDGLFTIKKTPARETTMLFPAKPVLRQDFVFFVRKGSNIQFNGDFASLANNSIGVVNATSYGLRFDNAAQSGSLKQLDFANNFELNFRKLLAERVDTVICSRPVGLAILKKLRALDKVEISGPPAETAVSYLAFSLKNKNSGLTHTFDNAIESMEKDGTIKQITKKYTSP